MPILKKPLCNDGLKISIICIILVILFPSCYNHLSTQIPYEELKLPIKSENCSIRSSTVYIKGYYNTSFTRSNGDTVFYSKNPNVRFNKIYADGYMELLNEYLKDFGHKVILLPKSETNNGPYLQKDLLFLVDSLKENNYQTCSDTATIFWFMNRNSSYEYEMETASIGNTIDYQSNLTSYVLVICNGKICFVNGFRTYSWYGPTMQYYKVTLHSLFDPFFDPAAKRSKKLVSPTTRVN
jgi:hypothetical protein